MSYIKIVIGQLLLQSALLQQIVDGAALAQVGFRYLDHRFSVIGFNGVKSSSTSNCSLPVLILLLQAKTAFGAPYIDILPAGKKIFQSINQ